VIGSVHDRRIWYVDAERHLHVRSLSSDEPIAGDLERALSRIPIPGARVLVCDAWRLLVLLADGQAWRLDWRNWRPRWVDQVREDQMHPIIAAGSGCDGKLWTCDAERRIWRWSVDGRSAIGAMPVPGSAPVLTVDIESATVMLSDGTIFSWLGNRWMRMPPLTSTGASMRVRCIGAFGVTTSKGDLHPGGEVVLDEAEARAFINRGVAEPIVEPAP
jgi:hypothetical protein